VVAVALPKTQLVLAVLAAVVMVIKLVLQQLLVLRVLSTWVAVVAVVAQQQETVMRVVLVLSSCPYQQPNTQAQPQHKEKQMSHFAKVENGIVVNVIVAEQDVIDSGIFGHGWVQTSYNTHGGQHPEGRPLRKNYAGIGYTYDSTRDAFIPPQPYPSWLMSEETCLWSAPTPMPTDDKRYSWDEATLSWVEVTV
jgi:hypothetical protein